MSKDAPIAFRIPSELKRTLVELATAERRSLSLYIQLILEKHAAEAASKRHGKSTKS